jgi:hypothetical protein
MMQKPRTYEPTPQTKAETVTPPEISLDAIDDKPRKKSKFEMDMEKFGSADAVKAAKQKEEADKARKLFNQDELAKESPPAPKERMTYNAAKKANAALNNEEDDEDFLAQQYAAKFLSENAKSDDETDSSTEYSEQAVAEAIHAAAIVAGATGATTGITEAEETKATRITGGSKSTENLQKLTSLTSNLTSTEKIQADSASKTMLQGLHQFEAKQSNNNLPRISELTDTMSDEDKRLQNFGKKGALSNEEKADLRRMQTNELQKRTSFNHGTSKKMEAAIEAEKMLKKAAKGRVITYIGAVFGLLSGLIVLLLIKSDNLIITGFGLGQVIVSLLLIVRMKFVKRITLFYSFVNVVILIFPGILGYQQNTELPDIQIIIYYAAALAAVFLLLFLTGLSPSVKLFYDIDFKEEKSKL